MPSDEIAEPRAGVAAAARWTLRRRRGYRCGAMNYRIEVSPTRKGAARVNFPGRIIALDASQHVGPVWLVEIHDLTGEAKRSVTVRADNAGDAVWRVARAAVRAVAELTGSPIEGEIKPISSDSGTI
jgi:hypothetical protein